MKGKNTSQSETLAKAYDSSLWKQIMSIWPMLDSMNKWEVRNGQTIKVWSDCWVDKGIRFIDYMASPIGN